MTNVGNSDGWNVLPALSRCSKADILLLGEVWQGLEEVEDSARLGIHTTNYVEVHGDEVNLLFSRRISDPTHILASIETILEVEADILRELGVAEHQTHILLGSGGVNVVGRLPAKDVTGSLGNYTLESHGSDLGTDFIVVDEASVDEGLRIVLEGVVDDLLLEFNLVLEVLGIDKR